MEADTKEVVHSEVKSLSLMQLENAFALGVLKSRTYQLCVCSQYLSSVYRENGNLRVNEEITSFSIWDN